MAHQAAGHRSGCPINLSLEVLGDSWSLIVIRDIMFGNRRYYRQLLGESEEGIASNILSDRLKRLRHHELITRTPDPTHKQRQIYSLTEQAIQLVPVLVQLGAWGRKFLPVSPELSVRAKVLEDGGPQLWQDFMDELRVIHLGAELQGSGLHGSGASVLTRLERAYQAEVAQSAGSAGADSPG
ncbi:winged helix-turn-helix transcriptional regulator [Garicola koreensis]|uniref:DNA-binding HxlR family transcriptional regulator n=1 Tax=Garicola koreensis TaxID=1262554 RepID=A0A7W5TVA3_9MICC|nr:helix-turn-helix domain-containing protein [Garicola koreensis]MBB3667509.1 DNA-binding HxlR family transcriptional regulator [Garicola koreensis]